MKLRVGLLQISDRETEVLPAYSQLNAEAAEGTEEMLSRRLRLSHWLVPVMRVTEFD